MKNNKTFILSSVIIIGVVFFLFLINDYSPPSSKAEVGSVATDFKLKDFDDKIWKLSEMKNKIVFLHFWASWCDACKTETPSIQNLINMEKNNDSFVFISVLSNDEPSAAKKYMLKNNFNFSVLVDTQNITRQYGVRSLPATFLIDKQGIIRDKIIGPIKWDSQGVIDVIKKLQIIDNNGKSPSTF